MRASRRFTGVAAVVFCAACQAVPPPRSHLPGTYGDSVAHTAVLLGQIVHAIDAEQRSAGAVPLDLERALGSRRRDLSTSDIWSTPLVLRVDGLEFQIGSAGRDREVGTLDDLVAVARLGRDRPCELRTPDLQFDYTDVAPPCAETPVRLLPVCPAAEEIEIVLAPREGASIEDRVRQTGVRLLQLAWIVDARGRRVGGVPPAPLAINPDLMVDGWGARVVYTPKGDRWEIRSPGPDRILRTTDDLVVEAGLAEPIPCEYRFEGGNVTCDEVPPVCPDR